KRSAPRNTLLLETLCSWKHPAAFEHGLSLRNLPISLISRTSVNLNLKRPGNLRKDDAERIDRLLGHMIASTGSLDGGCAAAYTI
ncbi:hypothetical protein COCMIDRAFT_111020, partial [Bipolaris oryzae ATCC 44560]